MKTARGAPGQRGDEADSDWTDNSSAASASDKPLGIRQASTQPMIPKASLHKGEPREDAPCPSASSDRLPRLPEGVKDESPDQNPDHGNRDRDSMAMNTVDSMMPALT